VSARIYISRDSGALCVGAEEVATAFRKAFEKRALDVEIVRTGSRGLYWLEPLVEVARPEGRIGYGPVCVGDIDGLLDAGMLDGGSHALGLGLVEDIPWLKSQTPSRIAASSIRVASKITRHMAATRVWRRLLRSALRRLSRKWSIPACAGAVARVSPPASNGEL
jgi:hypothetical protein